MEVSITYHRIRQLQYFWERTFAYPIHQFITYFLSITPLFISVAFVVFVVLFRTDPVTHRLFDLFDFERY